MTASVREDDRGLLYGDGVFDTMLAVDGRIPHLMRHVARLAASAAVLGIPCDEMEATRAAVRAAEGTPGRRAVRLTLTRGPGAGLGTAGAGPPTLLARSGPLLYTERDLAEGVSVVTASRRRVPPECLEPWAKTLNYLPNVLARREAEAAGAQDALLLSLAGDVVEATVANVFVVRSGGLATPPASAGCFPGFTRADVLALAAEDGIPAAERALRPEDVKGADEVFLTSSLAGVLPVVAVDGARVGAGRPGPVTMRLQALDRRRVEAALA